LREQGARCHPVVLDVADPIAAAAAVGRSGGASAGSIS
jgi:hypothetical protein